MLGTASNRPCHMMTACPTFSKATAWTPIDYFPTLRPSMSLPHIFDYKDYESTMTPHAWQGHATASTQSTTARVRYKCPFTFIFPFIFPIQILSLSLTSSFIIPFSPIFHHPLPMPLLSSSDPWSTSRAGCDPFPRHNPRLSCPSCFSQRIYLRSCAMHGTTSDR